jgi:SHS2 domain-containing protein
MVKFKFLEHTADVKFQAFGKTIEEAFKNSALALKKTIVREINVKEKVSKKFSIKGKDNEKKLYCFLEELLFLLDAENFLFSKVKKIKMNNEKLEAEVLGDNALNYKFKNDVKAITYNQMFVKFEKGIWKTQVVLDV